MSNNRFHTKTSNSPQPLYLQLATGEEPAFQQLFILFKPRLLYYTKQFLLHWNLSEDIVSETFLALWQHRHQIQSDDHLKNFLFLTARNKAINLIASEKRHQQLLQSLEIDAIITQEDNDIERIETEMMHFLDQAILTLPKECRRIFELSWEEEKTPGEIARILDMNPATVRSQKRRAIQLIQSWIRKNIRSMLFSACFSIFRHPF